MIKKIIAFTVSAILLVTPFCAYGETGVYLQNDNAVLVSDSEMNGYAAVVSYNSQGVVMNADVTQLANQPFTAQSIAARGLGYGDKVYFLDDNLAPYRKAYTAPYQGESDIPTGKLTVGTYPYGSDVYVDGVRYEEDTTPFDLTLVDGWHNVNYSVTGYEDFDFWVSLGGGHSTFTGLQMTPTVPESDYTITVNDATPVSDAQVDLSDSLVTFREAVQKANSDPAHSYTIVFDPSIETVYAGGVNNIEIKAKNLTVNGLKGREENVVFDFQEGVNRHYITVLPTDNFTIVGATFKNNCFVIRPDDNESANQSYSNIRIISCRLVDNEVFAFGGACKAYGTGASVNYKDLYFCGNELINSNCFFAYSGDCDNSVTDGIYYCSNLLDKKSKLTINCADCNTWYIYGRETEQGGLTAPETSDGNVVRNILVSGNIGGRILMSCSVGGNSNNVMENAVIRNNYTSDYNEYTCAQINNVRNEGQTLHTDGNIMRNFIIAYNGEEYTDGREATLASRIYVTRNEYDALDGSSTLYCRNNKMERFVIYLNTVKGVINASPDTTIGTGIAYEDLGENPQESVLPCAVFLENETPDGITYAEKVNNTFKGLSFFDNSITTPYEKTNVNEKKTVPYYAETYAYDKAVSGKEYALIALKGNPDNYQFNSDSLLYIRQFTADSDKLSMSPVIPMSDYRGEYVVLLAGNDGVITNPVVLGHMNHVHDYKLSSTVKPTCIKEGKKTYKCSVCGKEYVEKLDKVAHTIVKDKAVPATFKKAGKTAGRHCKVCGKVLTAQKKIAKLGTAKLTKVTKKKNTFTAFWKKVAKVDGYQLQYATNSKFKKAKTVKVKKNKNVKKTVKKLKKGKKYYVRIRAYKKINGKTQYSKWSKAKTVKL